MAKRFFITSTDIFLPKDKYTKLTLQKNSVAEDMTIEDDQFNEKQLVSGSLLTIIKEEMRNTPGLATLGNQTAESNPVNPIILNAESFFYNNSINELTDGSLKVQPDDTGSFYLGNVLSSILSATDVEIVHIDGDTEAILSSVNLRDAVKKTLNEIYKTWELDTASYEGTTEEDEAVSYSNSSVGHFRTNGKLILLENKTFQTTYGNKTDTLVTYNKLFDPEFSSDNTRATLETQLSKWVENGDQYYAEFDTTMISPFLTVLGKLDSNVKVFVIARCFPILFERVDLSETFHIFKFPEALATESIINSIEQRIYMRGLDEGDSPTNERHIYLGKNQMGTNEEKEYNNRARLSGNTNIINFHKRNLEYDVTVGDNTSSRYVYNWANNVDSKEAVTSEENT